jgi:hypothetical protein
MQGAFGTIVWIVAAVGVVGAITALLMGRRTWDDYGKHHLVLDSERSHSSVTGAAATLERDTEIRQLLEARNARRRRRGEPELDIEAEITRLTGPQIDPELRSEIRDLVIARNARRVRRGQPALDVEAEIEREIAGLSGI